MKNKILLLPFLFGALFFFTQCDKAALDGDSFATEDFTLKSESAVTGPGSGWQNLWAGAGQNDLSKGTLVGKVYWNVVGDILTVTYKTDVSYTMTEAHLWVGNDYKNIPKNAAPGLFPFSAKPNFLNEVEFKISLSENSINPAQSIFVAAHAVVNKGGLGSIIASLPDQVSFKVDLNKPDSYFESDLFGGTSLDGKYDSWCIDLTARIGGPSYPTYVASVHSSLDEIEGYSAEQLKMINWVVNRGFVGKDSRCGGLYTSGDVQVALWKIVGGVLSDNYNGNIGNSTGDNALGPYSECKAEEIYNAALKYGKEYVPGCGEKVGIVLKVPGQQTTIIFLPIRCGGDDTAWAYGKYEFMKTKINGNKVIAKKWGWFFEIKL